MLNRPISLVFGFIGLTAFGWAAACSSSNSTPAASGTSSGTSTSGTSGASGASGTTTGTTGTTGASGTGSPSDGGGTVPVGDGGPCATAAGQTAVPVVPAAQKTIVDQSVPSGQIQLKVAGCAAQSGTWYTDVDGNESAATKASLTPPNGAFSYTPIPGPADAGVAANFVAACISASNVATQYGTGGLGFNFATTIASDDSGAAQTPIAVDISAFTGISFWLWEPTDAGTPPAVKVKFSDKASNPAGGQCGVGTAGQCYDDANDVPALAPGWNFVQIPFSILSFDMFGNHDTSLMLDTKNAYGLTWQVQNTVTPALDGGMMGLPVSFNFCVANVSFY